MTNIPERLRLVVVERASNACEYCLLSSDGQVGTFPIDHVIPRSRGGLTELGNLAFTCPNWNAHKWAHTTGFDSVTGQEVALFNPRTDSWSEHFSWSVIRTYELEGMTPTGRATIARLQINDPEMILVRRLVSQLRQ